MDQVNICKQTADKNVAVNCNLSYYLGFSPQNTMSKSIEKSPYENINGSMSLLKAPQSPRTQIRTMLPTVQHQELRENEQLMVSKSNTF